MTADEPIPDFLKLCGGSHGGEERMYKVLETTAAE
jgi:hypothetical protein